MFQYKSTLFVNIKIADVNCGIGSFSMAAQALGAKCVFACEDNKFAGKVYQDNFGIAPVSDIQSIDPEEIPEHDILTGTLPYESFDFRSGELKAGNGGVYSKIFDIIHAKQPKAILLEIVNSPAKVHGETIINTVEKSVKKCGYKVYASELNASDYGVPQQRKRLYIVAFRKDLGVKNFRFPKPVALQKYVKDILEPEESIDEKKYVYDLSFVCKGNPDYFSNSPVKLGIIGKGGQGERVYSINGTAITVTAKSGGKFRNTGGYYVNGKLRRLTVRECARLMGLPDSFQLNCSETQAHKLLGNSVVVDVIEYILISMAEAMKKVDAI